MNRWQCDHHDCDVTATGAGGAIGLLAIGWWFGHTLEGVGGDGPYALLCPAHRPDPVPCDQPYAPESQHGKPCPQCAAEHDTKEWQRIIQAEVVTRLEKARNG